MGKTRVQIFQVPISKGQINDKYTTSLINNFLANDNYVYKSHSISILNAVNITPIISSNTKNRGVTLNELPSNIATSPNASHGAINVQKNVLITLFYADFTEVIESSELDEETKDIAIEQVNNPDKIPRPDFLIE